MKKIEGGVCAARGYQAAGIHCGIRANHDKPDLALIVSSARAAAAGVYTQNLVQGAPIAITKANLADGYAQAIICNSGNANTCNANGPEIATAMCELTGQHIGIAAEDVIVASTGVIGQVLDITPIANNMAKLTAALAADGSSKAATAIMTTDTKPKQCAYSFTVAGAECRIGGIAKGSGMINPNMATMLVFITSDCAISPALLSQALSADVADSFNMLSVDGDTSTNDMLCIMANGLAGNAVIDAEGPDYDAFCAALAQVTRQLCREIAADGEGATHLLVCKVTGAQDKKTARKVAKGVISSTLLKAAIFGADANWGRVLCAIGYSGADVDVHKIDVSFVSCKGQLPVCVDGAGIPFSEDEAKIILSEPEVQVLVALKQGEDTAEAWGCDLTYDYVRINGDYRS